MSKEISKFLSYVLRHAPESIGLKLDANGWAEVDELLARARRAGRHIDPATLRAVVAENDKQRFTFSDDSKRIRAAQRHSVAIDLDLEPVVPPERLYHGTAIGNLGAILADGLRPGRRRQVHLSSDPDTARGVGARHGRPVVLIVDAGRMHRDGLSFFRATTASGSPTPCQCNICRLPDPTRHRGWSAAGPSVRDDERPKGDARGCSLPALRPAPWS